MRGGVRMEDSRRRACPVAAGGAQEGRERGNMLVFGLGVWFVAVVMVLVVAVASDLYAERRDLLSEADSLALALADDVADAAYFEPRHMEPGGQCLPPKAELLRSAQGRLRPGSEVAALDVGSDGAIRLRLARRVPVAGFGPVGLPGAVRLEAEAAARLRLR